MARIIDKDTRLIDLDFGELTVSVFREFDSPVPTSITSGGNGTSVVLNVIEANNQYAGSFIQYVRLDLDYMVRNNEVMLPVEASIQRTSPVPLGFNVNGNNFDQTEEFIFILSRPLNNEVLRDDFKQWFEGFRNMGLNGTTGILAISGDAGAPTQEQTIYAEKRMYSYNTNLGATQSNGELSPLEGTGPNPTNSVMGMPVLDSVTTWGSMAAITGPNLHCYRVVIQRNQTFAGTFGETNVPLEGQGSSQWPAVSVRFLCKDPKYTEGEYLTRLANAMNNISEGGPVA
ncbi:unnamed protein product [marine sediment metagenome]|uniref:Uncharacterized protein n=1 Tax=marine sediment metagenome TaxID=412755 RepID=X1U3E5_9ZZZZ